MPGPLANSFLRRFKSHTPKISIAVLGPAGTGKSSFIAKATGKKVKTGSTASLSHCTTEVSSYKTRLESGQEVVLLDTPGYDLEEGPEWVLHLLRQWPNTLWARIMKQPGAALDLVFIFYHISDGNRISQETRRYFKAFDQAYRKLGVGGRVHIVTTVGNGFDQSQRQELENAIRIELSGALTEPQLSVHQFDFTPASAKKIIMDSLALNVVPGHALSILPCLAMIDD